MHGRLLKAAQAETSKQRGAMEQSCLVCGRQEADLESVLIRKLSRAHVDNTTASFHMFQEEHVKAPTKVSISCLEGFILRD